MYKFLRGTGVPHRGMSPHIKPSPEVANLRFEIHNGLGDVRLLKAGKEIEALGKESCHTALPLQLAVFAGSTAPARNRLRTFALLRECVLIYAGDELKAALRVHEGKLLGVPTGYFRLEVAKCEVAVIAQAGTEEFWLTVAVDLLLSSRRAFLFLITFDGDGPASNRFTQKVNVYRQRITNYWQHMVQRNFEATIAPLGRRTRRNLRYALAQAQKHNWEFVPDLTPQQLAEAVEAIRPVCTHPFSRENARERVNRSSELPGYFADGLRNDRGQWLSCVVGRRSGESTDIFWQVNCPDTKLSISTTIRAFLLRHESERGTSQIRFMGGTSPQMEHLCTPVPGTTLAVTRPGLRLTLLRLFPSALLQRCSSALGASFLGTQKPSSPLPSVSTETRKAPAA